jgi:hypothetical protein
MVSRAFCPASRDRQHAAVCRSGTSWGDDHADGLQHRRAAASLDYILVIGVVFLLGGLSLVLSSKIMVLAYDMICALVSWPFL